MSSEKNFGVRKDVLERWNRMMEADFSFVSARARSGGSGVDLYVLAMIIGLRIGNEPPLRSLEDKFQYNLIENSVDISALAELYGIDMSNHVNVLGRYAGEGINYIFDFHYSKEEKMLDLLSILETWNSTSELKRCLNCKKFLPLEVHPCSCGSSEFS